jgi:hypothetical protein
MWPRPLAVLPRKARREREKGEMLGRGGLPPRDGFGEVEEEGGDLGPGGVFGGGDRGFVGGGGGEEGDGEFGRKSGSRMMNDE